MMKRNLHTRVLTVAMITQMIVSTSLYAGNGKIAKSTMIIDWKTIQSLKSLGQSPLSRGLAGAFSGRIGKHLYIIGGANFDKAYPWEGGKKRWYREILRYGLSSDRWNCCEETLPGELAYGASIQLRDGFLCIGGCNKTACSDLVFYLTMDNGRIVVDSTRFPRLPVKLANMAATKIKNSIYILGGQTSMTDDASTNLFYCLDLNNPKAGWQQLPSWPGPSRGYAVCAGQGRSLYLFSGRSYSGNQPTTMHEDGYVFDTRKQTWRRLKGPFPVMAGTAIAQGEKLVFLGGVEQLLPTTPNHPGFSRLVRVYDTRKEAFDPPILSPYPLAVTTNTVVIGNTFYIMSGEIQPGIRTPEIITGTLKRK